MKWLPAPSKYGDIVRIQIGSFFHYGIFVTEAEIIQFGFPPVGIKRAKNEEIKVCVTDVDGFSCGHIVETGILNGKEKKLCRTPNETVEYARNKIGDGGYNLIHNNCEHFVNECVFGKRFSEQEESARKRWKDRAVLDVYVSKIPQEIKIEKVYPKEKDEEITKTTNEKLKAEKYYSWKVLEYALKKSMSISIDGIVIKKEKNGKWTTDDCYFSLSHTNGVVAVAVSNKPVGVDVENLADFENKIKNPYVSVSKVLDKICNGKERKSAKEDINFVAGLWTKKEATYKKDGKGAFIPNKIKIDDKTIKTEENVNGLNGYTLSVCGESISALKYITADNVL